MKKTIFCLIFILTTTFLFAKTLNPLYIGESICYQGMIKDKNGNKRTPVVGDIVYLRLKRTPESDSYLLELTGIYVSDKDDYNYTFAADSDDTADLAAGNAYWFLEIENTSYKVLRVIEVFNTTIKPR